jgi:predicted Zn-dependent peptidase
LDVLAALLGEIRLSSALREQRGMTYSTTAEVVRRRYARALLACTRLGAGATAEGLGVFIDTLREMRDARPSPEDLERARAIVISQIESSAEDVPSILGVQIAALEQGKSVERMARIEEVRAVKAEDIQRLARKVLNPDSFKLLMSGEARTVDAAIRTHELGRARIIRLSH